MYKRGKKNIHIGKTHPPVKQNQQQGYSGAERLASYFTDGVLLEPVNHLEKIQPGPVAARPVDRLQLYNSNSMSP